MACDLVHMFLSARFDGESGLHAGLRKWRHWNETRRNNRGIDFVLNLRICLEMNPAIFHPVCAIDELTSIEAARRDY